MFYAQDNVFDAIRDAAMALKAMGRWDLVLDRSIRYFNVAAAAGLVKAADVRADDDYPFRWLFPTNGFPVEKQAVTQKLRGGLFCDFRKILVTTEKFRSGMDTVLARRNARLQAAPAVSPLPPPPPHQTKATTTKRPRETAASSDDVGTKLAEKVLVNLSRDRIKIRKVSAAAEEKTKKA